MVRLFSRSYTRGFGLSALLLVFGIIGIGVALWALSTQTSFFNFAGRNKGDQNTITINTQRVLGSIDANPLGFSFEWQTLSPYPYDKWMYLKTSAAGIQDLKNLGIRSLRLWGVDDNWQQSYEHVTGIPPTDWVDPQNKAAKCDPLARTDCVAVRNFSPWCGKTVTVPTKQWLSTAASFGGPIVYVANVGKVYHLKPQYYTDCTNGVTTVRQTGNPSFTGVPLNPMDPNYLKALRPYLDMRDATPDDLIGFLRHARNQGFSIKWVEIDNEPWNGGSYREAISLANSKAYVEKLKRWYTAIKAFDPSIQVGATAVQVLEPGTTNIDQKWVEGWNRPLFRDGANYFDFIVLHHYTFYQKDIGTITPEQQVNLSYYRPNVESEDLIDDVDEGDYPKVYREQLLRFAPQKVNVPILMTEFNALVATGNIQKTPFIQTRGSLYAAFAQGSFYLDHLWPKRVNGVIYPGVKQAFLGGMEGVHAMFLPPKDVAGGNPTDKPLFFPSWYMLQTLQSISNDDVIKTSQSNKIRNSALPSRNALEVRAVMNKNKNKVQVLIFNHDPNKDLPVNLAFVGFTPNTQGTLTTLGEGSNITFASYNTAQNPNLIVPSRRTVSLNVVGNTVRDFNIPAHTFVLLQVNKK